MHRVQGQQSAALSAVWEVLLRETISRIKNPRNDGRNLSFRRSRRRSNVNEEKSNSSRFSRRLNDAFDAIALRALRERDVLQLGFFARISGNSRVQEQQLLALAWGTRLGISEQSLLEESLTRAGRRETDLLPRVCFD